MATCFLVLGTPRSGTSCIAGVLHHLGIVMGRELESEDGKPRFDWMDADQWNPVGYFQDAPLENLQQEIFQTFAPDKLPELTEKQTETLVGIIKEREALGVDWGSKTSRMAYLLPRFLEHCSSDVKLICTSRVKSESVASWSSRQRLTEAESQVHIDKAADAVSVAKTFGLPVLNVAFDDLLNDADVVPRIAEYCGRRVTEAAANHVDAGLRHFDHSDIRKG